MLYERRNGCRKQPSGAILARIGIYEIALISATFVLSHQQRGASGKRHSAVEGLCVAENDTRNLNKTEESNIDTVNVSKRICTCVCQVFADPEGPGLNQQAGSVRQMKFRVHRPICKLNLGPPRIESRLDERDCSRRPPH